MIPEGSTLASTYEQLINERAPFLRRAQDTAKLTLPHILVEGDTKGQELPTPYQSVGARGVTSLSSKLLLTLFPPSQPFFRYKIDESALIELAGNPEAKTQVESALKDMENSILTEMETQALRPHLHEALKQLVNGGNAVLHMTDEGQAKVHKLSNYVVKRDPDGNLRLLIIKEWISPDLLPPDVREAAVQKEGKPEDTVAIYTGAVLNEKQKFFDVYQESGGVRLEEGAGEVPKDDLPFLVLRMEPVTGESYGYGYATSYLGDLKSLEALSQALVEGSAIAAKVLFLVDPMAVTKASDLATAPNGAIRPGREGDVTTVRVEKQNDFRVTDAAIERISRSLGMSFLLNQSIQRKGERVTAEEIRLMAQELEDVLAGTYSLLSVEFQLPLVTLIQKRMQKEKRLPKPDPKLIKPTIVTGIEALGRGHDLTRLDTWLAGAQALLAEAMTKYVNPRIVLEQRANALGLKTEGLLRTDEEVAQIEQQEQLAAAAATLGPQAMQIANTNLKEQAAQEAATT